MVRQSKLSIHGNSPSPSSSPSCKKPSKQSYNPQLELQNLKKELDAFDRKLTAYRRPVNKTGKPKIELGSGPNADEATDQNVGQETFGHMEGNIRMIYRQTLEELGQVDMSTPYLYTFNTLQDEIETPLFAAIVPFKEFGESIPTALETDLLNIL